MKSKIIIILLLILTIALSGCTSSNNASNQPNISNNSFNQSPSPQPVFNNTTTKSNYEASGFCNYVVDGDTIDVEGVGRIRFVGVNTPERGQPGYQEAKDFVKSLCLDKTVGLDIDNAKTHDKYGRVLAVVYSGDINVNAELLKRGYAKVMYIPPSEFNPYSWS